VAHIVFGLGTSHGPMLSIPPEIWPERVKADRANPQHFYKGRTYTFDELLALRRIMPALNNNDKELATTC